MLYLVLIYIFNVRKIQKIVVLILPIVFFFLIVWRKTINQSSGIYEEVAVQANFSRFIGFWNFRCLGSANIISVLRAMANYSLDFVYI